MTNIYKLLNQIAGAEAQLRSTQFLAPCVKGGRVRTRVARMVYTFTPKPRQFEGWGIFQPTDEQTATLMKGQIYLRSWLLAAASNYPVTLGLSFTKSKLVGLSQQ